MYQRENAGPVFVKEALLAPQESRKPSESEVLIQWLKRLGAGFNHLNKQSLRMLARCLGLVHLEPGEQLIERPKSIYMVLSGNLQAVFQHKARHRRSRRSSTGNALMVVPQNTVFGFTQWWHVLGQELAKKNDRLGRRMSAIVADVEMVCLFVFVFVWLTPAIS